MNLPHDLTFLEEYLSEPGDAYEKAEWLFSPFPDPIWKYSFNFKKPKVLDWRVTLDDGSCLTDFKNEELLAGLKYWLTSSTFSGFGGCVAYSIGTQAVNFRQTINLIDYFLLNDDRFKVSQFGLQAISQDDLKEVLFKLSQSNNVFDSLFEWKQKVFGFAADLLNITDKSKISKFLADESNDDFNIVSPEDYDEAKGFIKDPSELPKLRSALYINGFIRNGKNSGERLLRTKEISKVVFKCSVRARSSQKSQISALTAGLNGDGVYREFPAIDVTTGKKGSLSRIEFTSYRKRIYSLGILHELGISAPSIEDLVEVNRTSFELKKKGRFRTPPTNVVLVCLGSPVNFIMSMEERL